MEEREEKEDQLPSYRKRTTRDDTNIFASLKDAINKLPISDKLKNAYRQECTYLQKIFPVLDKARKNI